MPRYYLFHYCQFPIGSHLHCVFCFFQNTDRAYFRCEHVGCGSTFASIRGYQQHVKRHSGIYQYPCPYCNKGFSATINLKKHLRLEHTGMLGFHCTRCGEEFQNLNRLRNHLQFGNCTQKENN